MFDGWGLAFENGAEWRFCALARWRFSLLRKKVYCWDLVH